MGTGRIRRIPKILEEKDLITIEETMESFSRYSRNLQGVFNKNRDKVIIFLMFYVGLRPAECLKLKWSEIHLEESQIEINPYNNKERNNMPAILSDKAKVIIIKYKEFLSSLNFNFEYVFPSLITGTPLNTDTFGKRFQRIVKEAGLSNFAYYDSVGRPKYTLDPYCMRHSFCTKIYTKKDQIAVTKLARHLDPSSANFYVHLNQAQKKDILDEVFS